MIPTHIKIVSYNRSIITKTAHKYKAEGLTWGEAQKRAWQEAKAVALIECLMLGVVEFSYIKADGTIRHAKGTTNKDLFVCSLEICNTGDFIEVGKNIAYFDFEAEYKRQCKIGRIQKIKRVLVYKRQAEHKQYISNIIHSPIKAA